MGMGGCLPSIRSQPCGKLAKGAGDHMTHGARQRHLAHLQNGLAHHLARDEGSVGGRPNSRGRGHSLERPRVPQCDIRDGDDAGGS